MNRNQYPPLLGYADRLSARPGDKVQVKVSSFLESDYQARLVRIICADPNPAGMGLVEERVDCDFSGSYPSRVQPFTPGSSMSVSIPPGIALPAQFTVVVGIWPTKPGTGEQAILAIKTADSDAVFILGLDEVGRPQVRIKMPDGDWFENRLDDTARERSWGRLWAAFSQSTGELSLGYCQDGKKNKSSLALEQPLSFSDQTIQTITVAAANHSDQRLHFDGKVERPTIYSEKLGSDVIFEENISSNVPIFACWDFSIGISSTHVVDISKNKFDGMLVNYPTRAMTGANWDGSEMSWRHAPEQYGAIHFHEDDIYDFNWKTDFSITVPKGLRSGVYGIRLEHGAHHDTVPLFVCPPLGQQTAKICVLVSTFTYAIYGNHVRPDYETSWLKKIKAWDAYPWNPAEYPHYGSSTYNFHSDQSGICHASYHRPLFNLRPGYLTFGANTCSGLRHFQADSHLTAWLYHHGYEFDIVTDKELHEEGSKLLLGYAAVTTGSHPEYHTSNTLNALEEYRDEGGQLAYLGGNGFYWRVAIHPENDSLLEIRRAEGGIRAWAAEPGEYYNAFDGQYGGLWRRNGRPPQKIAGVGFSSQGRFFGSYYRRTLSSYEERFHWMFEGIDDDILGNFGFSGGGAAGFELDRYDRSLGSPDNAVVVASSENHNDTFVLVPEEQLTHLTNWPGVSTEELIRADMVYFDTPSGGAIFSVGSITFCGSLPFNNFDNNISKLLANIFNQFLRG